MGTAFADSTSRYIHWATRVPQLSLKQELELAERAQAGDQEAARRVVEANLRHVVPQALKYRHFGMPVDELIAEGNAALMTALQRFDTSRGLRFSTYAVYWVRAEILQYILRNRHMVGGGRGALRPKFFFQLRKHYEAHLQLCGDKEQAIVNVAERFARRPEEVRDILNKLDTRDASLDAPLSSSSDSGNLLDLLPGDGGDQGEQVARAHQGKELRQILGDVLSDCSERDQYIVRHRLMVDEEERESLVAIGKRFGVSRERVRQLEQRLKERLKLRLSEVAERWDVATPLTA